MKRMDSKNMNRVTVSVEHARRQATQAITHMRSAGHWRRNRIQRGDPGGNAFPPLPGSPERAEHFSTEALARNLDLAEGSAQAAYEAANNALTLLLACGAARPGKPIQRDAVPLEFLDTPATRELLAALEAARALARRVDRERGWIDADGVGVGFEESLAAQHLLLEWEVLGPRGKE